MLGIGLAIALAAPSALAQQLHPDVRHSRLTAADYEAESFIGPVLVPAKRGALNARIDVTYIGFPDQARAAFDYAADLWETLLESAVTIHVRAEWDTLEQRTLGSAGPRLVANFQGTPRPDTWYPTALAESIAGTNFTGTSADIEASFNAAMPNWYFGLDGNPPTGTFDFVTVALHELAHGLGFSGSFDVDDGDSESGDECPDVGAGFGCWGIGSRLFPTIYDHFTERSDGTALLNTARLPNPSRELGDVLQSGDVFFEGASARGAFGDIPVDLYAPAAFEPGSSYSHLDERSFPAGTPNSLMTPSLARSEAIHSPGPVTCGIFRDLGWALGPACRELLDVRLLAFDAQRDAADAVEVSWRIRPDAGVVRVEVQQQLFGGPFETVAVLAPSGDPVRYRIEELAPGTYSFRLRLTADDGTVTFSEVVDVLVPLLDTYALTGPFPNPFTERLQLHLQVRSQQHVAAEAFDAVGRRVAVLYDGPVEPHGRLDLSLDAADLAAGVYVIRIVGDRFTATETAVRLR